MLEVTNIDNIKWNTSNWTYIMTEHDYVIKKNSNKELELPSYMKPYKYVLWGNQVLAYDLITDQHSTTSNTDSPNVDGDTVVDYKGIEYELHDYALQHCKALAKLIDDLPNEWAISETSLQMWLKMNE